MKTNDKLMYKNNMELKNRIGYACINMELASTEKVMVNRDIKKATFQKPGSIDVISTKALANIKGLRRIVEWNEEQGIKFYRMSSKMFPWWEKYKFTDLKDWDEIKENLEYIGDFARKVNQRLTFHPDHFCVLGSLNPATRFKARTSLEKHSELLDVMGFEPSFWNKMNIHIGSAQGGREEMCKSWIKSWKKLSENCRARVVVENDDKPKMYTTEYLYKHIHEEIGIPVTFDTLHHDVGPESKLNKSESAKLAATTWPEGMFVIHHSSPKKIFESEAARYNQHADYIYDKIDDFGTNAWIMVESKAKEKAILEYIKNGPMETRLNEKTLQDC